MLAADRREGESPAVDALVDEIRFAVEEITALNAAMSRIEQIIRPTVERIGQDLLGVFGVGVIISAGLIGHAGNMENCRNADAFAMRSATAPVSCSSGNSRAVRVNCGGDRQLNKLIHQIAVSQIRVKEHAGRVYYDRKISEGKTPKEARRCLKRRLATIIYYRLVEAQTTFEPFARRRLTKTVKWKSKFGGMDVSDVAKMRALEDENRRLKLIVADQVLHIDALKIIAEGNF